LDGFILTPISRRAGTVIENSKSHALLGIIQGGRYEDLRKLSAKQISSLDFDGFGIGGTFNKEDIGKTVRKVNLILPKQKPRHLLGIGDPNDIREAIKAGCDTFDCVAPTRIARNGGLLTHTGKINILNSRFKSDLGPIEKKCGCYTCRNYARNYVSHLFRTNEMLGATLASIHNLYFINTFVDSLREKILTGRLF